MWARHCLIQLGYYLETVRKSAWYQQRDKDVDQWNRTKESDSDWRSYIYLSFDRDTSSTPSTMVLGNLNVHLLKKLKNLCPYFVLHKTSPNGSKILAQDRNSKTTRGKVGKAPQSTEQERLQLSDNYSSCTGGKVSHRPTGLLKKKSIYSKGNNRVKRQPGGQKKIFSSYEAIDNEQQECVMNSTKKQEAKTPLNREAKETDRC